MLLYVVEIRHDGLLLAKPNATTGWFWLPASDWKLTESSWENVRDTTEPGVALNVGLVPGRYAPGRLQVVTMSGLGVEDLSDVWKGEVHGLKIESLSKRTIQGRIGAIKALMERDEYTEFLNRFPQNDNIQDHGALAVGDVICGAFRMEHGYEDRVQVSFKDALTLLEMECDKRVGLHSERIDTAGENSEDGQQQLPGPLFHTPSEALTPFLFVENDDLCRQMWQDFLVRTGIETDAYCSYEDAMKAIKEPGKRYKMAIVDIHLRPGTTDELGLDLAKTLSSMQPDCRIVLCSAEDNIEQKKRDWGAFPVHGFIAKPALQDEWAATIDAAASTEEPTPLREFFRESEAEDVDSEIGTPEKQTIQSQTVEQVLNAFCEEASGTVVHVFRLHSRSWRGRSIANAGGKLNWEPYRGKLGMSVIRDAARSDNAMVENDAKGGWRHSWTKKMIDYQSFWGQRLPVPGHYWYVLVAFHPTPGFFSSEVQLRAQCCAEQVARILSCQQLERRGVHDAEQSSAGLGFACLAHEIYSTLNGVEMAVRAMSNQLSSPDEPLSRESLSKLHRTVSQLREHIPDLVVNARILRGSAGGDRPISVVFCLQKAVTGIRQATWELLKHRENISLDMDAPNTEQNWMLKANAGALVTVFFNVLLNAVQQIDLSTAVRQKGWVHVAMQHYEDAGGLPWALVFISDSGPGIHPDNWERIFDAGYTTKEDGTGLGLYMCRQSLCCIRDGKRQASITIAESVLWAGTTIVIRFPLLVPERSGD